MFYIYILCTQAHKPIGYANAVASIRAIRDLQYNATNNFVLKKHKIQFVVINK